MKGKVVFTHKTHIFIWQLPCVAMEKLVFRDEAINFHFYSQENATKTLGVIILVRFLYISLTFNCYRTSVLRRVHTCGCTLCGKEKVLKSWSPYWKCWYGKGIAVVSVWRCVGHHIHNIIIELEKQHVASYGHVFTVPLLCLCDDGSSHWIMAHAHNYTRNSRMHTDTHCQWIDSYSLTEYRSITVDFFWHIYDAAIGTLPNWEKSISMWMRWLGRVDLFFEEWMCRFCMNSMLIFGWNVPNHCDHQW